MDYPYLWPSFVHIHLTESTGEEVKGEECRWRQEGEVGSEVGGHGSGGADEQGTGVNSGEGDGEVGLEADEKRGSRVFLP